MDIPKPESSGSPLNLSEAAKLSWLRWPSLVAFAGIAGVASRAVFSGRLFAPSTIGPFDLSNFDLGCIFACFAAATWPVWMLVSLRLVRGQARPALFVQVAACSGLLLAAAAICPTIEVDCMEAHGDISTFWIKRSLLDTLRHPTLAYDELAWLQNNFSAGYISGDVYCPYRTTRLHPFVGVIRTRYTANVLANAAVEANGGELGGDKPPPADLLKSTVAQCKVEGPAMLAAGLTKEYALMHGDVDRFFMLATLEYPDIGFGGDVVLEDSRIPAPILQKVNSFLASAGTDGGHVYIGYQPLQNSPELVRRLTPLALAAALNRHDDVAHMGGPP